MKAVDREQEPFRILGSSLSRPTHREDERVDLSSGRRRRGNISQRRQRHCHPPQFNSHRGGRVEDRGGEELREALVALKGPLGNVPAFRKAIESILDDEEQRKLVLGELKLED